MVAYVSFLKAPCNFDCKRAFKWLTSHVHIEEILGIISLDFDVEGQLLIIYSSFVEYLKNKCKYNEEAVLHLFIDFRKSYDSVRGEVLCNILIEFDIPMKLVRLIKVCPNETHHTDWVGKRLPDTLPMLRMVCNKEMLHHHWFLPLL
jgi:hypothetical protein